MVVSRLYPALFWNRKHLLLRMDFGWCCCLPPPALPASLCSLTRTCHQAQSPQLWVEAVVSLAVMGTVSPKLGWDLPSGRCVRCFSQPVSQCRAPSLCIPGLIRIHAWYPVCNVQCQILQPLLKKHRCAPGVHLAPAKE